jgi:DNA helicase-2/ATP-dependent DNA helicase PcrA
VHEREAALPRGDVVHLLRRCAALAVWHGQVRSGEVEAGDTVRRLPVSRLPSIDELFRELRMLRREASEPVTGSRLETLRALQRCVDPTIAAAPTHPASSWLELADEQLGVLALADAHPARGERDAIRELLAVGRHVEMQALALGGDVIGKVLLTTYHSAKGREFHTVILPGLVEGLVPRDVKTAAGWGAPTGKALQEQRRAFYVAISRAEEQVHLITGPGYHTANGYWINKGPSSFLADVTRHVDA